MSAPPLFLVGTRFQAMMVLGIVRHLGLEAFDVVILHLDPAFRPEDDLAFSALVGDARQVHRIDRSQPALAQLRALNRAFGAGPRLVLLAQIAHPVLLSLFRLRPGLRLQTFDEGGYNVAPDGPFFAAPPRGLGQFRRLRGAAMAVLFPEGPLAFVRHRSERHYTAFPPERNFMADRATRVELPWEDLALPGEVAQVRGARRIMVMPCLKDFRGPSCARDRILSQARGCDLVVRHPRDGALPEVPSVRLQSPVEGVVCALAAEAPVTVLHHGSTVGLTLDDHPQITLVDLGRGARPGAADQVAPET